MFHDEFWRRERDARWPIIALGCGVFVAALSLVGYGTFGLHPAWLQVFPQAITPYVLKFYAVSFRLFGEGQSWLLFGILSLYLCLRVGSRWVGAAAAVYLLSLGCELAGTIWGIPFGEYAYTDLMGAKILGHVPYVIPASWWMMALPAYAMAMRFSRRPVAIVLVGALWLSLWDVSLDPAMSYLTRYWQWKTPSGFYGMPWQNWLGWYLTSLLLMGAMRGLRVERWIDALSFRWLLVFYGLNIAIPLGMLVVAGVWGAVAVNLLVFGVCLMLFLPFWRESADGLRN